MLELEVGNKIWVTLHAEMDHYKIEEIELDLTWYAEIGHWQESALQQH